VEEGNSANQKGGRVMFSVEGWDERRVSWSFVIVEETKYNEILWLKN